MENKYQITCEACKITFIHKSDYCDHIIKSFNKCYIYSANVSQSGMLYYSYYNDIMDNIYIPHSAILSVKDEMAHDNSANLSEEQLRKKDERFRAFYLFHIGFQCNEAIMKNIALPSMVLRRPPDGTIRSIVPQLPIAAIIRPANILSRDEIEERRVAERVQFNDTVRRNFIIETASYPTTRNVVKSVTDYFRYQIQPYDFNVDGPIPHYLAAGDQDALEIIVEAMRTALQRTKCKQIESHQYVDNIKKILRIKKKEYPDLK